MSFNHKQYKPFKPISKSDRRWPNQVIQKAPRYCAVDLRDGNQALASPLNIEQKKIMFDLLVACGFKEIEVGYPSASTVEFDFCRFLIEGDHVPQNVVIQVMSPLIREHIKTTFAAVANASKVIIHLYHPTSSTHRNKVLQLSQTELLDRVIQQVTWVKQYAQSFPETQWVFQFSLEHFSTTESQYALKVINSINAIWRPDQGQSVIFNLPATVEASTPNGYADQVEWIIDHMDHREHCCISLHTHNDRGCAVAAAELGVLAGADRVEGTLLGNGERTGNMDLVTFAMNLYSQGIDPKLDFSDMRKLKDIVETCIQIKTHVRHPYAGDLVYTAFSGGHQDAIEKCLRHYNDDGPWEVAYIPINPKDTGFSLKDIIRINSQSGKGGLRYILAQQGYPDLPIWLIEDFARHIQFQAESLSREISHQEIKQIFHEMYMMVTDDWRLISYQVEQDDKAVKVKCFVGLMNDFSYYEGEGDDLKSAIQHALSCSHPEKSITIEAHQSIQSRTFNGYVLNAIIDSQPIITLTAGEDKNRVMIQAYFSALSKVRK